MRLIVYLGLAVAAGLVSFALSWVIVKLSHRYRLYPGIRDRDVHTRPTPRLGGVALFLAIAVAFTIGAFVPQLSLVYSEPGKVLAVVGSAALIVLLGVADDLWDLDWLTKLAGQFLVAGLLAWQGVQIGALPMPGGSLVLLSPYLSLAITALVVVLVMNAINFIDGLDGLVAGFAIITNGVFAVYVYLISYGPTEQSDYFNLAQLVTVVLVGACLGFLPWNARLRDDRPARLFMGDGGSMLVGLLMAASTLLVTGQIDPGRITGDPDAGSVIGAQGLVPAFIPFLLPFAVLTVPLVDFGLAVLRRMRAGKSPFSADRQHLHHRLLDMGHSHRHAVWLLYGWTAAAAVGCLLFLLVDWWWALGFALAALVGCTLLTLAPLSRRKRIEATAQLTATDAETGAVLAPFDPLDAAADELPLDVEPHLDTAETGSHPAVER
ncbi:MAG: undecaprenyl/decaprenyl-phosphate alpha-N-acetylglucosaminyl 1-phosphate transferase [Actinomycetales bacterium]|nr:undecaprenyl/decaprenyl-phosphate alpha-N-acetylglucosaminyl 1-phosphate transferase [Actinomycetales bacterium]